MSVKGRLGPPAVVRILDRCIEDDNGCWVFQGARSGGYGKVGLGGKEAGIDYCHRVTYRHFMDEIPDGLQLDHLCRNRACCNPWHLEPVPQAVNLRRGARGIGYRATHCKRGHARTPDNLKPVGDYFACATCTRYLRRRAA